MVFYRQTLAAVDGMVGSGGPKCRCGRWVSSFRSHDLAEKWQDPDLHKYVFLLGSAYILMYILFMYSVSQTICCFLCLSHLHIRHVLSIVVVGVGGHQVAAFGRVQVLASVPGLPPAGRGTDGRTTNRYSLPRAPACPRLPVGELFIREPPPELAPCF